MTRRQLPSRWFSILLAFALCGPTAVAGAQTGSGDTAPSTAPSTVPDPPLASGTVFEDRNGNGHGRIEGDGALEEIFAVA